MLVETNAVLGAKLGGPLERDSGTSSADSPGDDRSPPVVLDYRPPEPRHNLGALLNPMPRWLMVLCFFGATWPFWLTLTSPIGLYARPILHAFYGSITCGMALAAWAIVMFIEPAGSRVEKSEATWRIALRRFLITFGSSIAFIALHATAIPFNVLFALHYPLFEAERQKAAATLAPDQSAPHGWIGLFPVSQVRESDDGEIGFRVLGGSIYFDPTPATPDCVFYPPGTGGDLVGGWKWEATD